MKIKILLITIIIILASIIKAHADTIRVGLLLSARYAKIYSPGKYLIIDSETNKTLRTVRDVSFVKIIPSGIKVNERTFFVSGLKFQPVDNYLYFYHKPYYGNLIINKNTIGLLNVVNTVDLEKYLVSVLNGEVSSSWPIEALKAQAVAARTYAVYKKLQSKSEGHDVVGSVLDQVYTGGVSFNHKLWQAVRDTKGEVLTYQGDVIKAYYHSCCGGHTEDWEYAFSEGGDYARGKECKFCSRVAPIYWKKKYPVYNLAQRLRKIIDPLGVILSIDIYERDSSGRISKLKIKHSKGEILVSGIMIRQILGFSNLRSTRFDFKKLNLKLYKVHINKENVENQEEVNYVYLPRNFLFEGRGAGHGVGMCQWGAMGMAEAGYNYIDILKYYYSGVKIEKI